MNDEVSLSSSNYKDLEELKKVWDGVEKFAPVSVSPSSLGDITAPHPLMEVIPPSRDKSLAEMWKEMGDRMSGIKASEGFSSPSIDVATETARLRLDSLLARKVRKIEVRSKVTFMERARLAGPELNWELAKERIAENMLRDLVKALDESGLTNFTEVTGPDDMTYTLSIDVVVNE